MFLRALCEAVSSARMVSQDFSCFFGVNSFPSFSEHEGSGETVMWKILHRLCFSCSERFYVLTMLMCNFYVLQPRSASENIWFSSLGSCELCKDTDSESASSTSKAHNKDDVRVEVRGKLKSSRLKYEKFSGWSLIISYFLLALLLLCSIIIISVRMLFTQFVLSRSWYLLSVARELKFFAPLCK